MLYVDSQETACGNYAATSAFDSNAATVWITQFCYGASPPPPHQIQIDLGSYYSVSGFQYLPRQDQASSGDIANYEFYVSVDGVNWGTAVATGTLIANSADHSLKQVTFPGVIGRYVRLRALSEVNRQPWTNVAEFNVLGVASMTSGPQVATVTLNPASISGGTTSTATVTLTSAPLTNATVTLTSSTPSAATVPATVTVNAGTTTATFIVTSASSVSATTASIMGATFNGSTGAVLLTITPAMIPKTGWRVSADSEASDCGNYGATNAIDGNAATIWITDYCHGAPPPPHEIQIDLGDYYGISGFQYLPRQDQISSGDIANYEFYVSFDASNWGPPVAAGTLISNAADHTLKQVTFSGVIGRYVRLRAISEVTGKPWTNAAELNVLGSTLLIPQTAWRVLYVDSQGSACGNYAATNAFDGNAATMWITEFCNDAPPPPHEIQIDLGTNYMIAGLQYLPRQDQVSNGNIANYEFYVSTDGAKWGAAVSTGTLFMNSSDHSAQQVNLPYPGVAGRYVRLRALNEVTGRPWTNAAELNFLGVAVTGSGPQVATVTLNPASITGGANTTTATVTLTSAPPTNATLTLASSNPSAATVPDTVTVNAGATTATFAVTSASFLGTTTTSIIGAMFNGSTGAALLSITPTLVPKTGWRVWVDSEASDCGNYGATNAIDGTAATIWITEFCHGSPPSPHEIQIDLGDTYAITGFQYLPRQDQNANGNIANYEFFVSTDGGNWGTTEGGHWGTAVKTGTLIANAADHTLKQVTFPGVIGRYVRLRALSEVSGKPWTNAAELNVLGSVASNPQVASLTLVPTSITGGGNSSTATVTLTNAPATNAIVTMTNSNPDAATVPASVTVNAGTITASFQVTSASSVSTMSTSVIAATFNDSTSAATLTVMPGSSSAGLISHAAWRVVYVDSQATDCGNYGATNSFDGNAATMWVTEYCNGSPPLPHEIQIDLGANYNITGFQYLPRQDQVSSGNIDNYEFYVSMDGYTWGSAVSTGWLFTNASDKSQKQVAFSGFVGRYVRLRAMSEVKGGPWTNVAEFNVLGSVVTTTGPQVASVTLNPASIAGGNASTATVTLASVPTTNATVTLSSSNASAATVPATVTVNAGTTTATFAVTSASFLGTATTSIIGATFNGSTGAVLLTVTPTLTPKTGWHVWADSEATDCGNYGASNAIDGNAATMWFTEYCHGVPPPPPHEIQIDLGGYYNITGFQYLPRQDQNANGNIANYEFFVSMDGENWGTKDGANWGTAVASGTLINNSADHAQKQVDFPSTVGRYVRLRAVNEVKGGPWTAVAELNVVGIAVPEVARIGYLPASHGNPYYAMPIGIPDPGFGIRESAPADCTNAWNGAPGSQLAGCYYVDLSTGIDSGRTYGAPDLPRKTIPLDLGPGTYVEVHGSGTQNVNGLYAHGTAAPWVLNSAGYVWIRGADSGANRPSLVNSSFLAFGHHLIVENFLMDNRTGTSGRGYGIYSNGSAETMATSCDANPDQRNCGSYFVFRNMEWWGCAAQGTACFGSVQGGSVGYWMINNPNLRHHHIVYYNINIHDQGQVYEATDNNQNGHAFNVGYWVDHLWILNVACSYIGANCVQVNGDNGQDLGAYDRIKFIFVGKNVVDHTKRGGLGSKRASDVIFSQNVVHDVFGMGNSTDNGTCAEPFYAQYGPRRIWFLFNEVYNDPYGINFPTDDLATSGGSSYVVGNYFHDLKVDATIDPANQCAFDNSGYAAAGISDHGGNPAWYVNNTIWGISDGIFGIQTGYASAKVILNNIIGGFADGSTGYTLGFADNVPLSSYTLDYNNLPEVSAAHGLRWGSDPNKTSVAAFASAYGLCLHCFTGSPAFVSPTDPHLTSTSAARDTGALADVYAAFDNFYSTGTSDLIENLFGGASKIINMGRDATARPYGLAWDIGAYEWYQDP